MDLAKVQVSGIHARVACRTGISAGIVGARVLFDYTDPLWDGLIKNVVFEGAQTVSILNAGNEVALPAEVATDAGVEIRVGVCGVKPDGQMIIPTLWAELGIVQDAVPVDLGEEAKDPIPPAWAQLEAMIGDLGKLTTEEKTNLVAAVNELAQKSGGNADPEEVRRIVEGYLAENPPKGEKGDPGDDYVLTDADKAEIAELAAEMVEVPEGGTVEMKPLTFTGAVNATYDGSEAVSVEIPQGGGGGTGDTGAWELIGEVTSDGAGDSTGISIPCDLSQYKQVYVNAYNLPADTKLRVILRSKLVWSIATAFFGYNVIGSQNSSSFAPNTGKMNNIWSITGIAYNISGRIAAYGAAEAKNNGGSAPWRQGAQTGALMGEGWDKIQYISLDRNSSTDIVPEGCTLAAWGYK